MPLIALTLAALLAADSGMPVPAPYAGEQHRAIKALSEREIADLAAGRGMALAKAAELNGYPGPMHVLEHAEALALDPAQREATQAIFERMRARAQALGQELIEAERALDLLFASERAGAAAVDQALSPIGSLQAALRGVHLQAHVQQTALLTRTQRERYAKLRGYAGGHAHGHHAP